MEPINNIDFKKNMESKNVKLIHFIGHLNDENTVLNKKYKFLYNIYSEIYIKNKKRQRKKAEEITREFNCPNKSCDRSYGFYSSLIIHIKDKHKEYRIPNFKRGRKEKCDSIFLNFDKFLIK